MPAVRILKTIPSVLFCALLAIAGVFLRADDNPFDKLLPPKDSLAKPKLVVLKSGQVLQGEIEGRIGGYTIHSPTGSMVVQYEDVRTAAMSLDDAYQRMAKNIRNPTANDRIELAQWCLNVGLTEPAREELLAALGLEPDRLEARRLLIQIESQRTTPGAVGQGLDLTPQAPRMAPRELSSAGQVSRERVAEFSRQIQPLLLNTCGNAACHGGDKAGDFHLRPTARLSRLDTDANLQEILKRIDAANADSSLLLTVPRQPGGSHAAVFRGTKGQEQFDRFARWIREVARETGPKQAVASSPEPRPGTVLPAAAFVPAEAVPHPQASGGSGTPPTSLPMVGQSVAAPEAGLNGARQPAAVNDAFLRKILEESQPDPFDPEEFNRRVHGTESGRTSSRTR